MFLSKRRQSRKTSSVAKKALKLVRANNRKKEVNFFDTNISLTDIDEAGVITGNLFKPVQGTPDTGRIGDKCWMKNIVLNLRMVPPSDDDDPNAHLRVIMFYDKQNTFDTGDIANLLLPPTGDTFQPNSMYNVDHRLQWIKIFDRNFMMDDINKGFYLLIKTKKWNKVTQFNAGSVTANTGGYKIAVISNKPGLSATQPQVIGIVRFNFYDQ